MSKSTHSSLQDILKNEAAASEEVLEQEADEVPKSADYIALEKKLHETEVVLNGTKEQLAELQKEMDNTRKRAEADMDNTRKRAERDIINARKFALEKFANELLAIMDSVELGLQVDVDNNELAIRMREGLEMTYNLFLKTLEKFSIKQINPLGEIFNPELHQAISMTENPEAQPNTIIHVMQKGYLLNDRLLRPAMVVVAK